MKLNPDVHVPRFSLSTLLLLTAVVALLAFIFSSRIESRIALLRSEHKIQTLKDQLGLIKVVDQDQVYVQNLYNTEMPTFAFRVFLPAGTNYLLKVGEGIIDSTTGHPQCFASTEISGPGEQGIIKFHLGTLALKTNFKGLPETQAKSNATSALDPDRFQWVESTVELYDGDAPNHASLRECNPLSSVVLMEFSQTSTFNRALAPPVGLNSDNKRTFKIWIEPVPETPSID